MLIPTIFYGKAGKVMSRMRKLAKVMISAGQFSEYEVGPFLDTSKIAGQILLKDERFPDENFHCYALSQALAEEAPDVPPGAARAIIAKWLQVSLDPPWKFVGTLSDCSRVGLSKGDTVGARRYVEAAVRHWPAIDAERARFESIGGRDILQNWRTLFTALDILGLSPIERMAIGGEPQDWLALVNDRQGPG